MSKRLIYRNYTITSAPKQDMETRQWRIHIEVALEKGGNVVGQYWMPISYSTEAEADTHGITFGQRIIDGKIPGISLDQRSQNPPLDPGS